MTWTKNPPVEPGHYWLRAPGIERIVVLVFQKGLTLAYYIPGLGQFTSFYPASAQVEFAGPIPHPEEPEI